MYQCACVVDVFEWYNCLPINQWMFSARRAQARHGQAAGCAGQTNAMQVGPAK